MGRTRIQIILTKYIYFKDTWHTVYYSQTSIECHCFWVHSFLYKIPKKTTTNKINYSLKICLQNYILFAFYVWCYSSYFFLLFARIRWKMSEMKYCDDVCVCVIVSHSFVMKPICNSCSNVQQKTTTTVEAAQKIWSSSRLVILRVEYTNEMYIKVRKKEAKQMKHEQ